MTWTRALYTFFLDAFRPPYRTTPWIVLLYVMLSAVYNPNSPFNHWSMPDTDDYMRMIQTFNWMDGQSWFDMHVPHLNPQHPMVMHWARLGDVPLAAVLWFFEKISAFFQWNATRANLGMLTAALVPCFYLAGFLFLIRLMVRPLLGRNYAGLACFLVPLCGQLSFQFSPLRVDHDAYVLSCAAFLFFAMQCISLNIKPRRMAILAGAVTAIGMWVSAEMMPMLLAFGLCLTVFLIWHNRGYIFSVIYGLAFFVASGLLLFLARAPGQYFSLEYDYFSLFHVIVAAVGAVFFILLFVSSRLIKNRMLLASWIVFLGALALDLFLRQFPDFIAGPYAKVNPLMNEVFFPNIREAIPFTKNLVDLTDSFGSAPNKALSGTVFFIATRLYVPVIGIVAAALQLWRRNLGTREKLLWVFTLICCSLFTLLSCFWQVRVIDSAQMFAIAPLLALMLRSIRELPQHYKGRQLFGWEILTALSFTLIPTVLVPSTIVMARLNPDTLFFSGGTTPSTPLPCESRATITDFLLELRKNEKKQFTIMAPMDYTPELMFYTDHNYISAPYHRNDHGIVDMVFFFRSLGDDATARNIAKRLGLDYVLVCRANPHQVTLNNNKEIKSISVFVGRDKIEAKPDKDDVLKASLGFRMVNGKAPTWLERVDVPLETDFLLFKVDKNLLDKPTAYPKDAEKS